MNASTDITTALLLLAAFAYFTWRLLRLLGTSHCVDTWRRNGTTYYQCTACGAYGRTAPGGPCEARKANR